MVKYHSYTHIFFFLKGKGAPKKDTADMLLVVQVQTRRVLTVVYVADPVTHHGQGKKSRNIKYLYLSA